MCDDLTTSIENIKQAPELALLDSEYYVYEYYIKDSQEVFYVGKGKGDRAWKNVRNQECEKIKSEYSWDVRIIKEGLSEDEALTVEKELIEDYRKQGIVLTNIVPGGVKPTEKETIGYVKYISFLVERGVLQMSLAEIGNLFLLNHSVVWNIIKTDDYSEVEPLLPENINEIIHRYHVNSYTNDQICVGNIKYVLNLIDKGVLKISQAQLAAYYDMTPSNVSSIKKGHTHPTVPKLLPDDIGNIFKEFNVFYMSEEEKKRGMVMFILRLRNEGVVKLTNREIGRILDLSDYLVAEYTRTDEERKYVAKEYRPNTEVMVKLGPYFVLK